MTQRSVVIAIFCVQFICAVFFVWDILSSVFDLRSLPINWQFREFIEMGAALGLILGLVLGAIALHRVTRERNSANEGLRRASTVFMELLDERFAEWGLTPAEKDVALFSIKGLSLSEIAQLRATSDGTVKAQTNAIYRKAGVSGRPQLLSLFIEDLMRDDLRSEPGKAKAAPQTAMASEAKSL